MAPGTVMFVVELMPVSGMERPDIVAFAQTVSGFTVGMEACTESMREFIVAMAAFAVAVGMYVAAALLPA